MFFQRYAALGELHVGGSIPFAKKKQTQGKENEPSWSGKGLLKL